ncbi:hypothetical protein PEX1_062490 [Penicillium expansum]|uniref:Uncharacterized protein n=1 Tax=Penicillium expansum TaxID=27334 RepID=A0A0A2JKY7_PENEN|nr:hypothetical protein PEX2_062420 [Penicillium expansum]KGO40331.1 hypothetical protein PEXP_031460 [Penicillium expansum]KGO52960.1 hypothetical protein PEX2_062420 [Penicillium expansum]KGO55761.1 hypothetical protein PEX1_062490 [Penicillium expansum]
MPPKQSKTDSRAVTILFKKHKTTVLLMLQPHESLKNTKSRLLDALKSREVTAINGDIVPDDSVEIEFGEPVDRADLEKGWKRLQVDASQNESVTIMEAGLQNGHSIAFRFKKSTESQNGGLDMDLDGEDPGWDVIIPSYEEEPEKELGQL